MRIIKNVNRYFCRMKQSLLLLFTSLFVFISCKDEPKIRRQEDLPDHRDTSVVSNQSVSSDSLNIYIKDHPNDVDALIARAYSYIDNHNLKYAIADAQAVLEIDSLNPKVLLLWGDVNYLTNHTRISKNAWEKCIAMDNENVDCRLKLAELYNIVQEYNKSLKLVDEVIDIDNTNPVAFYIKGMNIRAMKRDTAVAMQYFQKAIDLDNNYIGALDVMGVMLSSRKDSLALVYFNRILEIDPNHYPTYYNLGMFHLSMKNWNEAIRDFTKCTQLRKDDTESFFNLGYIHLQLKNYDIARDYFTQSINAKPSNFRAYYGRAYSFEMLGDITNAAKDYREALTYNPQHQPSIIGLKRVMNPNQ